MAATPSKPSPKAEGSDASAAAAAAASSNASVASISNNKLKAAPLSCTPVTNQKPMLKAPPVVLLTKSAEDESITVPSNLKKTPPGGSIGIISTSASGDSVPPTYQSSEQSRHYQVAKVLLNGGDFETALSTIEEGIECTKAQLPADVDATWHESMAPFHYLYGTTLLYSIEEESTDGSHHHQPVTTVEGRSAGRNYSEEQGTTAGDGDGGNNGNGEDEEEPVEDMEIAWENLDTARTILERLLQEQPAGGSAAATAQKFKADLAQVLLREGDLQRQNGAYDAAVDDYTACLSYLNSNISGSKFSRKIADVHCNLGLVYFNLVVETKTLPEDAARNDPGAAAEIHNKLAFCRSRGFYHYFECAKTFGGIVAELSGTVDPAELLRKAEELPQFKSTGEEEEDCLNSNNNNNSGDNENYSYCHPRIISLKLRNLRALVAELPVPEAAAAQVADCLAVLEEIQETIDEAEASERGVAEASAMKDDIISALLAAQAADDDDDDENAFTNATTTTTNTVVDKVTGASTTIGFGSAAATAMITAAAQQPAMMVVKKKKKRDIDEDSEDAKLPAKEPSKRAKSSDAVSE